MPDHHKEKGKIEEIKVDYNPPDTWELMDKINEIIRHINEQ